MPVVRFALTIAAYVCAAAIPAIPAESAKIQPSSNVSFADIADLADASEIVAEVKIRKATKIKIKGKPPGQPTRFLVEANVLALIRGEQGLAPRIRYVAQAVPDDRGKLPKLDRAVMIVFAVPVPDNAAEIRLAAPDGQLWWNEALGLRTRDVVRALSNEDSPPRIAGIASAFHSPGALVGEGETQIFLDADKDQSASLIVVRTAGQPARWTAAFGDVSNPDAPPPPQGSIGWYRLACFLPDQIPAAVLEQNAPEGRTAIATDYALIRQALGPCQRLRAPVKP